MLRLIAFTLLLTGCLNAPEAREAPPERPEVSGADPDAAHEGPGATTSPVATAAQDDPATAPLVATACNEVQAAIPADRSDFEGGLPPDFQLVLDPTGHATIVVLARSCLIEGTRDELVLAAVLVEVPASLQRSDAWHACLLSAWTDSDAMLGAFQAWGLTEHEERGIQMESLQATSESHTTVEPDFLLTVDTLDPVRPGKALYGEMRIFEVIKANVTSAFDSIRDSVDGRVGAASAHFIVSTRVGDVPDHRAGTGLIVDRTDIRVAYQSVAPP